MSEDEQHPIKGLVKTAMENLKEMTDVNTIIGDPVETPDGSVILTVSKVGFGFAAGGSQFKSPTHSSDDETGELPFGGGSGGGVSITPIAFLIVSKHGIETIHLDNTTHLYEKLLNLAPHAVDKVQQMMSGGGKSGKSSSKKEGESEKSKSEDE